MSDKLKMTFDPRTIEHLGVKMYSTLPPAIAELVANAYDACATEVMVKLSDEPKTIEVVDNGTGMTFDEVNDNFLRIGRNRRADEQEPPCERFPTGKKGLGKLALFGIGKAVEVITKKDGKQISFTMNWEDIISTDGDYEPEFKIYECEHEDTGTIIRVHDLKRKSSFDKQQMAQSISKLFNFADNDFKLSIQLNNDEPLLISRDLKYNGIDKEFEWDLPANFELLDKEYEYKNNIRGKLFASPKPLKPGLRGITLYANGRMVNLPEFFGATESSFFFSYLTGYMDIDFIDTWEEDVISTDRQSLDWENEKLEELRIFLKSFLKPLESDWRKKRDEKKQEEVEEKSGINSEEWLSKTPPEVKEKLEKIIDTVVSEDSELTSEEQAKIIETVHELVPEYPYYHWRYIHPEIKRVSERYYESKDYYTAFLEALKRYIAEVRRKSGSTNRNDRSMMGEVFSGRKLSVTNIYKRTDGTNFSNDTIKNIEEGQHYLSEGIVTGGRNPLSHEEHRELSLTGLFSEKDCLDFLSLLSHLFKRLEDATNV